MGRTSGLIALVVALVLISPAAASGSELKTWKLHSSGIDPAQARIGVSPKPGFPKLPRDSLRVNVMLPDGYNGKRRFPVLFLLHGIGWGYDYWMEPRGGDLREIGKGLEAIVVMPEGGRGWYTDWWNGGRRTDPAWERFHVDRLIRAATRRLRVRRGRRWHAMAGFSMGGLGAALYAARRPDYFGSVALMSGVLDIQRPETPAFFDGLASGFSSSIDGPAAKPETHEDVWGDPEAQEFWWAAHNPTALAANLARSRVFLTVGNGSPFSAADATSASTEGLPVAGLAESYIRTLNDDFISAAGEAGVTDLTVNRRSGLHSNFASRLGLSETLAWGPFHRVESSPHRWRYATAARRGRMWQFRFRFNEPPDQLVSFERRGRWLRGEGKGRVRLRRRGCRLRLSLPDRVRLRRDCAT